MDQVTGKLRTDTEALKKILPSEDVFIFTFRTEGGADCTVVYADVLTDKELLGLQVIQPMLIYQGSMDGESIRKHLSSPEVKTEKEYGKLAEQILIGNPVLLWEGADMGIVCGTKKIPTRAIAEPPTDVVVKGPREGFIEDVKTNQSLVRRRLKTPELKFETLNLGRRSQTAVTLTYLDGIAEKSLLDRIRKRLNEIDTDTVPDSSYVAHFLAEKPRSLVKQIGTTEKPDIFCAKLAEGRVGILVDGSPIALTLPYLLVEDFQSSEDYFVPSYRATFTRLLRLFALIVAIYAPSFYIAAQLFKLQFFPLRLLLTIAGSIRNIPLSPSLEMFLLLLVLEILNEASIRMPKYVGMALSVVGALVLGETAVSAGFVSTPAVIIIAFSGIGLYAVPNLIEITSVIRLVMLLAAGSAGAYGMILVTAFILFYLIATQPFGIPLLAPFSPAKTKDLRDTFIKYDFNSLPVRPASIKPKNKRRHRID